METYQLSNNSVFWLQTTGQCQYHPQFRTNPFFLHSINMFKLKEQTIEMVNKEINKIILEMFT